MTAGAHFLVSGRWDNNVTLVSLERALDPANFATSGAIVTRTRVTPTIEDDGDSVPASGQPVSIAIAAAGDRAGSLSRALDRAAASRADAYLHP